LITQFEVMFTNARMLSSDVTALTIRADSPPVNVSATDYLSVRSETAWGISTRLVQDSVTVESLVGLNHNSQHPRLEVLSKQTLRRDSHTLLSQPPRHSTTQASHSIIACWLADRLADVTATHPQDDGAPAGYIILTTTSQVTSCCVHFNCNIL